MPCHSSGVACSEPNQELCTPASEPVLLTVELYDPCLSTEIVFAPYYESSFFVDFSNLIVWKGQAGTLLTEKTFGDLLTVFGTNRIAEYQYNLDHFTDYDNSNWRACGGLEFSSPYHTGIFSLEGCLGGNSCDKDSSFEVDIPF